jgi:hypothetical protein
MYGLLTHLHQRPLSVVGVGYVWGVDLLAAHLKRAPDSEFVFSTRDGSPIRRSTSESPYKPAVKCHGVIMSPRLSGRTERLVQARSRRPLWVLPHRRHLEGDPLSGSLGIAKSAVPNGDAPFVQRRVCIGNALVRGCIAHLRSDAPFVEADAAAAAKWLTLRRTARARARGP